MNVIPQSHHIAIHMKCYININDEVKTHEPTVDSGP